MRQSIALESEVCIHAAMPTRKLLGGKQADWQRKHGTKMGVTMMRKIKRTLFAQNLAKQILQF